MFEHTFDIDAAASEAELRDLVTRCERLKAAAAAAQARATAAWAAQRRAAEDAAGVPARRRGRGLATEIALARLDAPVCGTSIWVSRTRWCTRCPTRWPRWRPGSSPNIGPP